MFWGEEGPGHHKDSNWGPSSLPNVYTNTHTSLDLESVSHVGREDGREVESAWECKTWHLGCTNTALTQEKQLS